MKVSRGLELLDSEEPPCSSIEGNDLHICVCDWGLVTPGVADRIAKKPILCCGDSSHFQVE
jgi:hypothetical protein